MALGNTPAGHAAAGGGVLNYATANFTYPGDIRTENSRIDVSFDGLKPLSQTNVTNILQSVPKTGLEIINFSLIRLK